MNIKTINKIMALGFLAGVVVTGNAQEQESGGNLLLRKLVEKGILTQKEADNLLAESQKEAQQQFTMWQAAPDFPSWIQKLSMKGDLRLRYDNISANDDVSDAPNRTRWRYRLRYGVAATLNDEWSVGFRLSSGSDADAGSTNTSFDDDGENDALYIDQAYVKWTPSENHKVTAGKMANTFSFDTAIIDGDYTPEGVAYNYERNLSQDHSFGLGAAGWVIDESDSKTKDPYAIVLQATLDSTLSSTMTSHLGVGTYTFINTDNAFGEATKRAGNTGTGQYNPIIIDGSVTYKGSSIPITLGGSYITNPAMDADENGYLFGLKFNKAKAPGSWELSYQYRRLEADSLWDNWADSDYGAYGVNGTANEHKTGTNVRGHVIKAKYQVNSAMQAAAAYYIGKAIKTPSDSTSRIQLDLIWKF